MAACVLSLGLLLLNYVSAAPQASQALSASSLQPSAISFYSSSTASASPSALPSLTSEERDRLFELHEELVNIPSISNDEVECAEYISEYLEELGYHVEKVPVGNTSTYNVFAYPKALRDEGMWPEVLITSHIDTVREEILAKSTNSYSSRYHHSTPSSDERRMAQCSTTAVVLSMPKAP
jgi:acetylornithine deacetylase